MEAESSSRPQQEEQPTETTALLGSSPERLAGEGPEEPSPEAEAGGRERQDSSREHGWPSTSQLRSIIRGLTWTSFVLAILSLGLVIALTILEQHNPPEGFTGSWRINDSIHRATGYVAVLFVFDIVNLLRRFGGSWETWLSILNLIADAFGAAYVLDASGTALNYSPAYSYCDYWRHGKKPSPECNSFSDAFNVVATVWVVVTLLFGLAHLVLFLARCIYLVRTHRTTRYITYEGTAAAETVSSLSLTLGPFAFDFRFRVLHPLRDIPAGVVRENETTQPEVANVTEHSRVSGSTEL